MIQPRAISGFYENLPEAQILEDNYKEIIRKNYALSGFTSVETPSIERLETLTAKGGDDSEIYAIHRLKAENLDNVEFGLRFDLTVPFARYIAQFEGEIAFPFKRQQIQKVWRGERPQKGRFREFYQADVDVVGNGKLDLFADVEVLATIYNSLKELNFGDFVMNINNKKLLQGFLESIEITDIVKTIGVIDKKDKVKSIVPLLEELGTNEIQIEKILELIDVKDVFAYFGNIKNELLQAGLAELKYVYNNLLALGVQEKNIFLNPAISRGLNYYTGTVFETFITGYENFGSISSGGRYENLCSNFTKNNYPGVGGSIGLSRLLFVLGELGITKKNKKTITEVLVVNMSEELMSVNLELVQTLRNAQINTELFLESGVKIVKQFKYANNKNIPYVIVLGADEVKKGVVQLKDMLAGTQEELSIKEVIKKIK